jgi:hypothetical protein
MSRGVIKFDRYEELAGQRYEFRQWRRWRRERVQELLDGPYAEPARALLAFLRTMTTPTALIDFIRSGPWVDTDEDTRFEILALIDATIITRREKMELAPFDDALEGEPLNVFLRIRDQLNSPPDGGRHLGRSPAS